MPCAFFKKWGCARWTDAPPARRATHGTGSSEMGPDHAPSDLGAGSVREGPPSMLVDTAHAGHDPQPSAVAVQPEQTPSDLAGSLPPSYEPQAAADDAPSAGAADPAAAQPGPSIGAGAGQPAPWQAPVYVPDAMYWHQQAAAREFVPLPPDLVRPRRTVEELPELRFIEADPTVFTGVSSEVLERATAFVTPEAPEGRLALREYLCMYVCI